MLKLSFRLLFSRKKWAFLLSFSISMVLSAVLSIYTATDVIKANILHQSVKQYGQFSGVLHDSFDDKEIVSDLVQNAGRFGLIGEFQIANDKTATLGWVDQNYITLGHISLISGVLPTKTNEVAIEAYYHEAIDPSWQLGETRDFVIGTENVSLKLTGIIDNYSARWSVGTEIFRFPNLFLYEHTDVTEDLGNHYLVPFKPDANIKKNIDRMERLFEEFEGEGFLNERLFFNGLKDYDHVSTISLFLQILIILVSSSSFLCLISFFNHYQVKKNAIFKALGCTDKGLFKILFLQIAIIYFFGILFSIPLLILFHNLIVTNTYGYELLMNINVYVFIGMAVWLCAIFSIIALISYIDLKKQNQNSISVNLRGGKREGVIISETFHQINKFVYKQVLMQLLTSPKKTLLAIMSLTFSLLVVIFSFVMAKETEGIWDTEIDYYLSSQEIVGFREVDGHKVVINRRETFHPVEVREVENLKGINYIDKIPFMMDVSTIVESDFITPTLRFWADNKNGNSGYDVNKTYLPNVNFILKTNDEISELHSDLDLDHHFAIIYIPNLKESEREQLIGKEITLERMSQEESIHKQSWTFKIAEVVGDPYIANIDETRFIIKDGISLILNENDVLEKGITEGYKDLMIYTNDNLPFEEAEKIYHTVNQLMASVPGGLFQYVPDLIQDNTRISELLKYLGQLAFFISLILAIFTAYTLVFSKYQSQKSYWGIYRSLGMSANKVFWYVMLEIVIYIFVAIFVSVFLLLIFLYTNNTIYPATYYIQFAVLTSFSAFFTLMTGVFLLKFKIRNQSISSMLRLEDG